MKDETARLLITCPDRRGIIAAVAGFVTRHSGHILDADQHTGLPPAASSQHAEFFMRLEIELEGFGLSSATFRQAWASLADEYNMRWRIYWGNKVKRMAILVTNESHCLNDLLWRWRTGECRADRPLIRAARNTPFAEGRAVSVGVWPRADRRGRERRGWAWEMACCPTRLGKRAGERRLEQPEVVQVHVAVAIAVEHRDRGNTKPDAAGRDRRAEEVAVRGAQAEFVGAPRPATHATR